MKEFLVVIVALILLIAFPIQGLIDAAFDAREQVFDSIVRSYAEKARLEGCYTQQIINDMDDELCDKLPGLAKADLVVEVTTIKKYRSDMYSADSLIMYSVTMPLRNRFVGGPIFGGIEDDTHPFKYKCEGSVTSEALP
jgi:hypothetical protein